MQNPLVETMENRRLFSISFSHHVLSVVGAGGSANTIVVGVTPDHQGLSAHLSFAAGGKVRNYDRTVPFSKGIRFVLITGGNQNDSITVDQTNGAYAILTKINSHNGNDTVTAGDEADSIVCGNGIDVVYSHNGNDVIRAGKKSDTIVAGDGNDTIHAGQGHDMIVAGNGTDAFVDPFGYNNIMAGSGHDLWVLRDIKLDPTNFNSAKDTWMPYNFNHNGDSTTDQIVNGVLDYLGL